jgi:Ca2+-binding RTX toxin-like protein
MVAIDFADFPGVNMQDPAGLWSDVLSAYPVFNFTTGHTSGNLLEIPNNADAGAPGVVVIEAYTDPAVTWVFNGSEPSDSNIVESIRVNHPGTTYRLVMVDFQVTFLTLENALLGKNLSALYAGQALEILGTATNNDTLVGGTLADEIYGYGGNDVLFGGGGNDYLDGMDGRDTMSGGAGDDDYGVNNSRDVIDESSGEGKDLVIASATYRLPEFVEDIALFGSSAIDGTGNALANYMEGNAAANQLRGLAGNDTLTGLGGNDRLDGGDGNDQLVGGNGADVLRGGNGNDSLTWHAKDRIVDGGAGNDTLKVVLSLNLLNVDNDVIADIELVSLAGNGANRLTLNAQDVLNISSTSNTLKVLGEAGDIVDARGSFVELNEVGAYIRYRSGDAKLWVESDIAVI